VEFCKGILPPGFGPGHKMYLVQNFRAHVPRELCPCLQPARSNM